MKGTFLSLPGWQFPSRWFRYAKQTVPRRTHKKARLLPGSFYCKRYLSGEGFAFELLSHELPVDQVPERFHILWTHVAVVDVVSVFPDVAGQQRGIAAGQRVAGADGAGQGQGTVSLFHQPAPTGTEGADGRLAELFLELVERTEGRVDGISQCAGRLTTSVWRQAVPVESVVPDLSGVVENTARRRLDDFFQGLAFELGAWHQVVQVHDIGVVVLVVVVFQGFLGNVRLQGIACVGQRRQFESHDDSPNQVSCGERKADHGRPNKRRGVCTLCGAGSGS